MDVGADAAAPAPGTATWRVLLGYARPHWRMLLVGGLLSLATAASGLALPLVVRELIGSLGTDRPIAGLVALMSVLVVANAAIGALGGYVLRRTAETVVLAARRGLLARLLRLRLSAVERHEPGDLMSRVTADTTLLREVTIGTLVGGVTGFLTMLATVVLMALLDLVMLAVTLAALGLAVVVIGVVVPRINRASKRAQESVGVMGAALERMFGAFRTVKASGAEEREGERLEAAATEAWRASVHAATWSAIAGNTAGLAIQVAFIAVLSVGGFRVAAGSITIGTLVAFLLYVFFLIGPVNQLAGAVTEYHVGAAAVTRILEAEALPIEPASAPVALPGPGSPPASVDVRGRPVPVCARPAPRPRRGQLRRPARRDDGVRRPVGRGEDDGALAHRTVLRTRAGPGVWSTGRRCRTGRSPGCGRLSATWSRTLPSCPAPCGRTSSSGRRTPPTRRWSRRCGPRASSAWWPAYPMGCRPPSVTGG